MGFLPAALFKDKRIFSLQNVNIHELMDDKK